MLLKQWKPNCYPFREALFAEKPRLQRSIKSIQQKVWIAIMLQKVSIAISQSKGGKTSEWLERKVWFWKKSRVNLGQLGLEVTSNMLKGTPDFLWSGLGSIVFSQSIFHQSIHNQFFKNMHIKWKLCRYMYRKYLKQNYTKANRAIVVKNHAISKKLQLDTTNRSWDTAFGNFLMIKV